jgi:glycerol-3-phosphate dehydrogenase
MRPHDVLRPEWEWGMTDYDLVVVGGGICGAGIARDAAGRGLKVLLVEKSDLGAGASSACAGLLRDGLAEVRRGEFRRAHMVLADRANLLRIAPHVVRPMRVVLPEPTPGRPAWLSRLELLACDHLARRSAPPSRSLDLTHHGCGDPLRRRYTFGFEFPAAAVDSARLTVLVAVDAGIRGATIRTRTRLVRAERSDLWTLMLNARGRRLVVTARAVVNATGAWTGFIHETIFRGERKIAMRLVRSSRIVVSSLFDHASGYALEIPARGMVFAIPFATGCTLIEAAHDAFVGDPENPIPTPADIQYLCDAANAYFRQAIFPHDVVRSFATVSCVTDGEAGIGGARLILEEGEGRPPLLSVCGGSLNAWRRICEVSVDRLMHYFAARPGWTRDARLPGGEFESLEKLVAEFTRRWRFLASDHAMRLARAYGWRTDLILGEARGYDDLGPGLGGDLTAAEVRYLMRHEWAETAEDVLWRRSRLGFCLGRDDQERLDRFMAAECGRAAG